MGFANSIIGGAAALIRAAIKSPNFVAGAAGWTINKDGSAEFDNVTVRGTVKSVSGSAFAELINGALICQDAGGDQVEVTGAAVEFLPSGVGTAGTIQDGGTNELDLLAPVTPGGGNQAEIQLISSATTPVIDVGAAGLPNGNTVNLRGTVNLGASGTAQWNDTTQQLGLPAGAGPFIPGETYHSISLAAGLSGSIRVRKEPNNVIRLDARISWTATSATTFTCGSLPDATYYPTSTILLEVTHNGTPTALAPPARIFIAGSGAIQVIVPATSGGASTASCEATYPNN